MFDDEVNESKEFDSHESASQPDTTGETDWEQGRIDTLAGFENNTPAIPTTEKTVTDSESLLPEAEDPYSLRTEQSFHNHPFSKLGLVSISTLLLAATAGVFLSANLMQTSEQKPRERQGSPTAKVDQTETDATDNQGRVLTDLALTTQGKDLEALNEPDKQHSTPEQASKPDKPTTPKTSRTSARTYAPSEPRPRPVAAYSSARPVTAYSPPRTYTPPRAIPKPAVQPSPVVQRLSVEPSAPAQARNPMERWIAAAQLGSHGHFSAVEETTSDETTSQADIATTQTAVEYAAMSVPAKSKQQAQPQTSAVNFDEETPILQEHRVNFSCRVLGLKRFLLLPLPGMALKILKGIYSV